MISPWEIYWVLQLDSIRAVAWVVAFVSAFAVLFFAGLLFIERIKVAKYPFVACLVAAPLSVLMITFLPSTKTAAAMFVIPAIANNETVQNEAGELYKLAKDALRDAVDAPNPPSRDEE